MAENITTSTRSTPIPTRSSQYFFNLGGTFGGATATLEWAEEDSGPWYPIKDSADADLVRTSPSNGVVTTGKQGYLSIDVTGASGTTDIRLSLISV